MRSGRWFSECQAFRACRLWTLQKALVQRGGCTVPTPPGSPPGTTGAQPVGPLESQRMATVGPPCRATPHPGLGGPARLPWQRGRGLGAGRRGGCRQPRGRRSPGTGRQRRGTIGQRRRHVPGRWGPGLRDGKTEGGRTPSGLPSPGRGPEDGGAGRAAAG